MYCQKLKNVKLSANFIKIKKVADATFKNNYFHYIILINHIMLCLEKQI